MNNDQGEKEPVEKLGEKYGARLWQNEKNTGFSEASNRGARMATGDILLFLNPDTEFLEGNFQKFLHVFEKESKSLVGLSLKTESGKTEAWSYGKAPTLLSLFTRKISGWKEFSSETKRVDWVSGAALALRKETFEALGGFDEGFFLYYEDVDLCQRAQKKGFPVLSSSLLSFLHHRGQSHSSPSLMKEEYFRGQRLYFEKHRSIFERIALPIFQTLYRFLFV